MRRPVAGGSHLRRRWLTLAFFLGAATLFVATALAQTLPSNDGSRGNEKGGLINGGTPDDCRSHHFNEGMRDSHIIIPRFPKMIPKHAVSELELQVFNYWEYEISEITVSLNFTPDENGTVKILPIVGPAEEIRPVTTSSRGTVGNPLFETIPAGPGPDVPPSEVLVPIRVRANAAQLFAHVELSSSSGVGPNGDNVNTTIFEPGADMTGDSYRPFEPMDGPARNVTIQSPQLGDWTLRVRFFEGQSTTVSFGLNTTVNYRPDTSTTEVTLLHLPRVPEDPEDVPVSRIPALGTWVFPEPIQVQGIEDGEQTIIVNVTARLWYKHTDSTGATPNEDVWQRYATVKVMVGDHFEPSETEFFAGAVGKRPFFLVAGEITGFTAAALLLPSLLLGGTYGRASRKFFNLVLGGAKRRVMFHNLLSMGLVVAAVVHIVFLSLEIRYSIRMGILWGGFGALSLLVLGLTGYYQVPLIQKYGYNWWRYVHLVVGLVIVVFVGYHSLVDGPHYDFLDEELPPWVRAINLSPD